MLESKRNKYKIKAKTILHSRNSSVTNFFLIEHQNLEVLENHSKCEDKEDRKLIKCDIKENILFGSKT